MSLAQLRHVGNHQKPAFAVSGVGREILQNMNYLVINCLKKGRIDRFHETNFTIHVIRNQNSQ